MAVVQLSHLRVSAEMDVSQYTRAMAEKVAADTRGAASSRAVGAALAQVDAAADGTGGAVGKLSGRLLDGYRAGSTFEKEIRAIGRAVDTGLNLDRAVVMMDAAYRKFGLMADATDLARQGFVSIAPAVAALNAQYTAQANDLEQATVKARQHAEIHAELAERTDRAAAAMDRARASQAAYNQALGINEGSNYDPRRIEAWSDALQRATAVEARYLSSVREDRQKLDAATAQTSQRNINTNLGVRDDFNTAGRAADMEALGHSLDVARAKYDPLWAATKRYQEAVEEINASVHAWGLTQEHHQHLLLNAETTFRQTTRSLQSNTAEIGLNRHQWANLGYQINDAGTMLLSGSSFFQVMATQGGQVYQVLSEGKGGVAGSIKAIGEGLMSLVTPARLVVGGLAAIGAVGVVSLYKYVAAQKEFDRALMGMGASTMATSGQLEGLSASGARAAGISLSSAREMSVAFTETGKIGTDKFIDLTKAAASYAYVMQVDSVEGAKSLAKAMADPLKGAQDLDRQLNFLDQTTLDQIRTLTAYGQKSEAQNLILRRLNEGLPAPTARLTLLGRAWQEVASFAGAAATAMGQALATTTDEPSLDEQLKAAQKKLADLQRAKAGPKGRMTPSDASVTAAQGNVDAIQARQRAAAGKAEAAANQHLIKDATGIAEARNQEIEQINTLISKRTSLSNAIAKGGNADLLKPALEGVNNEISSLADADDKLKAISARMKERSDLQIALDTATTQSARIAAQRSIDAYEAKARGADNAAVAAIVETNALQAQAQLGAEISAAARDRLRSSEDAILTARNELDMIGKTAGQQAEMNANLQATIDLRRQAALTGVDVDQKELAALKAKNAEIRRTNELRQDAQLKNDMDFEMRQLGRTPGEQAIASELRGRGMAEDLGSSNAGIIRMTNSMKEFRDTAKDAISGFVGDLESGVSASDALANSIKRIAATLADKAIESALSGLFGGGNSSSGGVLGSLVSGLGGSFGSGGTVGGTAGASMGLAGGGPVYGAGNGTSDSILARLSNGEHVINARSAGRHRSLLNAINENRVGFAAGGMVGNDNSRTAFGGMTFAPVTHIEVSGNGVTKEQIVALVDERDRNLRGQMGGIAIKAFGQAKYNNFPGLRG